MYTVLRFMSNSAIAPIRFDNEEHHIEHLPISRPKEGKYQIPGHVRITVYAHYIVFEFVDTLTIDTHMYRTTSINCFWLFGC